MTLQGDFRRIAVVAALAAAAAAAIAPAASAAPPPCQAKNVRTGVEYKGASALATAIADAAAGDTVNVYGTCFGSFQVGRDLTLQGKGRKATLDGDDAGRVLRVNDGTTTLRDLTITHGRTTGLGGGINIRAGRAAVLIDVDVVDNVAGATQFGGGIEADAGSRLTLVDSTVRGNSAGSSGGIDMFSATVSLTDSAVTDNHATRTPSAAPDGCGFGTLVYACAGGVWNYHGTLVLTNSVVSSNTAAYRGGGLRTDATVQDGGAIDGITILSGTTAIASNTAADQGGGIWAAARTPNPAPPPDFLPADADGSVRAADGTASFTDPITGATLPAWTGSLSGNSPDQCFPTLAIGSHTCGPVFG